MTARRIVVVGASSVLGRAAARVLAAQGSQMVLTHHRAEKRSELRAEFPQAAIAQLDVSDAESIAAFAQWLKSEGTPLDGLVYAAGTGLLWPASHTDDRRLSAVMEINVSGAFRIVRVCFPWLQQGRLPAVVLISSIMGQVGAGGMCAYGAAKAALAGMARALAIEWAARGIRVNAVSPGIVPSPLVEAMFKVLTAEDVETIRQRHPMGFGEADDVGHAIAFLLSPQAKWITGVLLPVDGGYTAQ